MSIELVKVVVKVYILSMGRHSQCLEKTKTEVYTSLVARKPHHIKAVGLLIVLNLSESVLP